MRKDYRPGGEVTCPAACQDLRSESHTQGTENSAVTLHDKAHMGESHDYMYVAVRTISGRTPAHKTDTGEAWVMCALVPGDATDLLHKGSPYHILDKHR